MTEFKILIHGSADDPCCRLTERALSERGAQVLFIDEPCLFPRLGMSWEVDRQHENGFVLCGGERLPVTHLSGALLRWPAGAEGAPRDVGPEAMYVAVERRAALVAFWQGHPTLMGRFFSTR